MNVIYKKKMNSNSTKKAIREKNRTMKEVYTDQPMKSKGNIINNHFSNSDVPSTSAPKTKDDFNNHYRQTIVFDKDYHSKSNISNSLKNKCKIKTIAKIKDQKPHIVNSDESENSSEEKGSSRKDRKPLPLIFNRSRISCMDNNDSSSEASEDTKETDSCKCVYLGERETLASFWDKCLYQCFKSKRCVAGEKPKRKYRKKPKNLKPLAKKRKQLEPPLSCIDTRGTAVTRKDYLSRYEMLLFMDPLADSMSPWQKKDFEMAFRMVKPSDIFTVTDDNNDESTDYTNSDTDQEVYDEL